MFHREIGRAEPIHYAWKITAQTEEDEYICFI